MVDVVAIHVKVLEYALVSGNATYIYECSDMSIDELTVAAGDGLLVSYLQLRDAETW